MVNRRKFLLITALTSAASAISFKKTIGQLSSPGGSPKPIVISTWNHGLPANEAAWKIIEAGGKAIDAVEAGVKVPEADPESNSVGYGGYPDRNGNVTLDACIMDETGNCGSVSFLQHIMHPISVARKVMDETPHVMLSGSGALDFALKKGFKKKDLLTEESKQAWNNWLKSGKYKPIINKENHDTIGLLAIDQKGDISGACTTSGLAWKYYGRVGDSPIIGAGMFVDNEVGGAVATGMGEAVLKTLGTFLVVELMRNGATPQEACEEAVKRIAAKQNAKDFQVGYLALDKSGNHGAHCIHKGFSYALHNSVQNKMHDASFHLKDE
jgi:isoaspartyl peptidase/L-asparaginase-like protein (Ntn-hydrolase superfamily)